MLLCLHFMLLCLHYACCRLLWNMWRTAQNIRPWNKMYPSLLNTSQTLSLTTYYESFDKCNQLGCSVGTEQLPVFPPHLSIKQTWNIQKMKRWKQSLGGMGFENTENTQNYKNIFKKRRNKLLFIDPWKSFLFFSLKRCQ